MFKWLKKKPKWAHEASLAFKDSNGVAYYQFDDDFGMYIPRMDMADVVRKEIENRVSNKDLDAFLENHKAIIFSDQKPADKLSQLAEHVRILKDRRDLPPAPELLMRLVALFYIREDEDPYKVDKTIWDEKVKQFLKDMDGGHADFFLKSGLSEFLPSSITSISSMEELLRRTQAVTEMAREREAELREAIN